MDKSKEQEALEAFRQLFDPESVNEDIELEQEEIKRWEDMKSTYANKFQDSSIQREMNQKCDAGIDAAKASIERLNRLKEKKKQDRDKMIKMIEDMKRPL